jgi:molybdopterin/thiamine biosynthesis adenylyltransferase
MSITLHEAVYRGEAALQKLAQSRIVVCGAGAIGSQLVDNLVRHGAQNLVVIDRDRVEEHNIGTQVYDQNEIGAWKTEALQSRCFRATGVEIEAISKTLDERNIAKHLKRADLVIDAFDNSASRRLVTEFCNAQKLSCLHLGVNADYGEVQWNDGYRVPNDVVEGNACDYPLARNVLLFTVAIGSECALRFLLQGVQENYSFTLGDLSLNREA